MTEHPSKCHVEYKDKPDRNPIFKGINIYLQSLKEKMMK
jgi:hypothetical protein